MVFIYKVTRLNYFYTQYVFQIHTYLVIQIVTDLTSFFPLVNSCCFSVTGITFSPEWPVFYHFYCVREAKKSASLATNLSASFFFCVVPKTCCSCWFYARDKKKIDKVFETDLGALMQWRYMKICSSNPSLSVAISYRLIFMRSM